MYGTGQQIAEAVMEYLHDWNLQDITRAVRFDTNSSDLSTQEVVFVNLSKRIWNFLVLLSTHHFNKIIMLDVL